MLDKKPDSLSGGYQSRASPARTMPSQPEVMLLDEPLSDIDAAIKERLIPDFKRALGSRPMPVIHVTHDLMEAENLGDRFWVMIGGRLPPSPSAPEAFESIRSGLAPVA